MAKNQLVKAEDFKLVTLEGELAEAVKEELDGLGPILFDVVKIPSGGGLAFELPGEDEDSPEMVKEIVGVILHHYPVNAYWREKYNGNNNPPDCASLDGKVGTDMFTGEKRDCASCPHNQYGSNENGKGKACKNTHRCYILREGEPIPLLLTLPPTSLKALRDFIGKKVLLKNLRTKDVIMRVMLKKEKSADGIVYSKAVFAFLGELTAEQKVKTGAMAEQLKTMTQPDITNDDYNVSAPKSDPDRVFETPSDVVDEELPPEFVTAEETK